MAVNVPGALLWLLELVAGSEWPKGDEDGMRGMADDWRAAAADLRNILRDIDGAEQAAKGAYLTGEGIDSIVRELQSLARNSDEKALSVDKLATFFDKLAQGSDGTGTEIEYGKILMVSSLALLALELAASKFFPPAAPAADAAAIAATRLAVRRIYLRIVSAVARRVASMPAVRQFIFRHMLLDTFIGAGQEIGIQAWQVATGGRDGMNWGQVGMTTLGAAVGGAVAGPLGDKIGRALSSEMKPWLRGGITGATAGLAGSAAGYTATAGAQFGIDVAKGDGQAWNNLKNGFDPRTFTAGLSNGAMTGAAKGSAAHNWQQRMPSLYTPTGGGGPLPEGAGDGAMPNPGSAPPPPGAVPPPAAGQPAGATPSSGANPGGGAEGAPKAAPKQGGSPQSSPVRPENSGAADDSPDGASPVQQSQPVEPSHSDSAPPETGPPPQSDNYVPKTDGGSDIRAGDADNPAPVTPVDQPSSAPLAGDPDSVTEPSTGPPPSADDGGAHVPSDDRAGIAPQEGPSAEPPVIDAGSRPDAVAPAPPQTEAGSYLPTADPIPSEVPGDTQPPSSPEQSTSPARAQDAAPPSTPTAPATTPPVTTPPAATPSIPATPTSQPSIGTPSATPSTPLAQPKPVPTGPQSAPVNDYRPGVLRSGAGIADPATVPRPGRIEPAQAGVQDRPPPTQSQTTPKADTPALPDEYSPTTPHETNSDASIPTRPDEAGIHPPDTDANPHEPRTPPDDTPDHTRNRDTDNDSPQHPPTKRPPDADASPRPTRIHGDEGTPDHTRSRDTEGSEPRPAARPDSDNTTPPERAAPQDQPNSKQPLHNGGEAPARDRGASDDPATRPASRDGRDPESAPDRAAAANRPDAAPPVRTTPLDSTGRTPADSGTPPNRMPGAEPSSPPHADSTARPDADVPVHPGGSDDQREMANHYKPNSRMPGGDIPFGELSPKAKQLVNALAGNEYIPIEPGKVHLRHLAELQRFSGVEHAIVQNSQGKLMLFRGTEVISQIPRSLSGDYKFIVHTHPENRLPGPASEQERRRNPYQNNSMTKDQLNKRTPHVEAVVGKGGQVRFFDNNSIFDLPPGVHPEGGPISDRGYVVPVRDLLDGADPGNRHMDSAPPSDATPPSDSTPPHHLTDPHNTENPDQLGYRAVHSVDESGTPITELTLRYPVPGDSSPADIARLTADAQSAADRLTGPDQRLLGGDRLQLRVEITTDPNMPAADHANAPEQPAARLREQLGLPPVGESADLPLTSDDLRRISNDIAAANTGSPLRGLPETRPLGPGRLTDLEDPSYQHYVEDALRERNQFVVGADPRTHPYGRLINDGGPEVPGRGDNHIDTALAALSSFYGDPQISVPRHPGVPADGTPNRTGEIDGPDRAARWLRGDWTPFDPQTGTVDRLRGLHDSIAALGPGSAALVIHDTTPHHPETGQPLRHPDGTPGTEPDHTMVVVFPRDAEGPVWWNPLTGETFDGPPADQANHATNLRAIALHPDGTPFHGDADPNHRSPDATAQREHTTPDEPRQAHEPSRDEPPADVTDPADVDDPNVHKLPEEENERIFREKIVPEEGLADAATQRRPVVVIVGGQTGAGKTAITTMIKAALQRLGNYINIDMDRYNPHHPDFRHLQAVDEARASAKVRPDGDKWWEKAQQYAIEHRNNVILESAMFGPAEFEHIVTRFHETGYRVDVVLVAVPEALSRLGILSRYLSEVQATGRGRWIDPAIHNACYEGVRRGAAWVDATGLADQVFVFPRGTEAVYSSHPGHPVDPPGAEAALTGERGRAWSERELRWFADQIARLRAEIDPRFLPEVDAIEELGRRHLPPRDSATPPDTAPRAALPPGPAPGGPITEAPGPITSGVERSRLPPRVHDEELEIDRDADGAP